jgi:hypothetical protein
MARKTSSPISTNPLVIDPEREHRVRERAYFLWESEGKPHGRDVEYWERARELVASEEAAGAAPPLNAKTPDSRMPEADSPESRTSDPKSPAGKTSAKAQRTSEDTKSETSAGRGKTAAQPAQTEAASAAKRKPRPKGKKG